MDKKIEEAVDRIVDKVLEQKDDYSKEPEVKRLAARTGTQAGEPEKPISYQDWLKQQPKTGMPIGIHKQKKRKK